MLSWWMIYYLQQQKLHNLRPVLSKDGFLLIAVDTNA